jgi:hypothetical protein
MTLEQMVADLFDAVREASAERRVVVEPLELGRSEAGWYVNAVGPNGLFKSHCASRVSHLPEIVAMQAVIQADRADQAPSRPCRSASFARNVRKRDGACVVCGSTADLHAHHVSPVSKDPERVNDIGNGITLCARHHRAAHRRNGDISGR